MDQCPTTYTKTIDDTRSQHILIKYRTYQKHSIYKIQFVVVSESYNHEKFKNFSPNSTLLRANTILRIERLKKESMNQQSVCKRLG